MCVLIFVHVKWCCAHVRARKITRPKNVTVGANLHRLIYNLLIGIVFPIYFTISGSNRLFSPKFSKTDLGILLHLRWSSLQQLVTVEPTTNGQYLHVVAVISPCLLAKLKSDENGYALNVAKINYKNEN